jgi:hypothetical protein
MGSKKMGKNFYMGYDLEKAGFNFSEARAQHDEANLVLLQGIAANFFKVSKEKGKLKGHIHLKDLVESNGPVTKLLPIALMSVDGDGRVTRQYISRDNIIFNELFEHGS